MLLAIVDDDGDVRLALARLLRSLGHQVRLFVSAEDFEAANVSVDCAILDVRLTGISGPELRDRMRARHVPTPVVFITGHSDPKRAELSGALDAPSLAKPVEEASLMAAITAAIESSRPRTDHAV